MQKVLPGVFQIEGDSNPDHAPADDFSKLLYRLLYMLDWLLYITFFKAGPCQSKGTPRGALGEGDSNHVGKIVSRVAQGGDK